MPSCTARALTGGTTRFQPSATQLRPLGLVAQSDAGHAVEEGLLLHAAGIRRDQPGIPLQPHHIEVPDPGRGAARAPGAARSALETAAALMNWGRVPKTVTTVVPAWRTPGAPGSYLHLLGSHPEGHREAAPEVMAAPPSLINSIEDAPGVDRTIPRQVGQPCGDLRPGPVHPEFLGDLEAELAPMPEDLFRQAIPHRIPQGVLGPAVADLPTPGQRQAQVDQPDGQHGDACLEPERHGVAVFVVQKARQGTARELSELEAADPPAAVVLLGGLRPDLPDPVVIHQGFQEPPLVQADQSRRAE